MSANHKADAAWDDYVSQQQEEKIEELERELNAANERIKRLEEVGDKMADVMIRSARIIERESPSALAWLRAKEDKI